MSPTTATKRYGPLAVRPSAAGHLAFTTAAGHAGAAAKEPAAEAMNPADLLMASLGSCIAISLDVAAQRAGVDPGAFEVTVEAVIDGDLPRHFNRFAVRLAIPGVADRALAEELLARAERMCTVSHTLNADIRLELAS